MVAGNTRNSLKEALSTTLIQRMAPGPYAAEMMEPGELAVRIDRATGEKVKYSDRDLLHLLFPELFPYGRGGFQLFQHKRKYRQEEDQWMGDAKTIKEYCKYRLQLFDRSFGVNYRFISCMYDWQIKDATGGYRLRTTTTTQAGGQVTTQHDVLSGESKLSLKRL